MKRMLISNIYNKRVDKIRSGLIDHCQKSTRRFKREKKTYLQYTHTHIYKQMRRDRTRNNKQTHSLTRKANELKSS